MRRRNRDAGGVATEYALLAAFIAAVVAAALLGLGLAVDGLFASGSDAFP